MLIRTTEHEITLQCDICGVVSVIQSEDPEDARLKAEADGWSSDLFNDRCSSCTSK